MNRSLVLLVLLCVLGSAFAAEKQVYKWTDANGVVHFTDAPPPKDTPNVKSVHLVGGTTTTADAPADTTPAATDKPKQAVASAPVPAGTTDDAALCKQARANLELLQGKGPVGVQGADGKADVLDDNTRAAQVANAQQAIRLYCK